MKPTLILFLVILGSYKAFAQIDTTSYPTERQEIRELMGHRKPDVPIDCNDFIAVGPKGDISFSHQQWQGAQAKEKAVFKSVRPIPGHEFIRIYEGKMAVVNFLANVQLVVDGHDVNLKVRRLEVYHKTSSGWCRVAGQGTEVDEKLFPVKTN
ncbi:nuclear transport factor 2 family protein [Spirosoma validum]|uniref:Nuclear transport factor 2 family protein n=1 Tax=Spirosoma validum TaxID=2771355 RepID=A0A927GH67_9BACT|nr:nuclear transport factor 2 family protein [Spirosoma validum]MBD2757360.1 nuclear transport factor 2 family protein [Spirosoma validum]